MADSFAGLRYLLIGVWLLVLGACGEPASAPGMPEADAPGAGGAELGAAGAETLGYERVNSPNPLDQMDTHIYRLDNGLLVYLTENREEPRFYAEIAVRAGSKHDPADATGLAHYLEHLLFKGNRNLGTLDYAAEAPHLERIVELYEQHFATEDPAARAEIYAEINATAQLAARYAVPNEIDKLYNSMGATGLNAHTSNEETVYRVGLPSNRLRQWAEIESDRFVDPVFRLFHTELETVYEEKNRALDNRGFIVYTALNELLFPGHPYGTQPTIGTVEHLKNPSLVYIQDYFDTWYVPNNMAVLVSGDIDIPATIELIADKFGHWAPGELPEMGPWDDPSLDGPRRATVRYPGEEQVQIAFPTAPYGSPDREALILLDMILDNRTAGLINLNLNQRQRVAEAGSAPIFLNDAGYQLLYGVPKQDQSLGEVEQLLLEQIDIIKAGEFEDWIIPAIINDFAKNEKAGLESNTARVTRMRDSFIRGVDWDHRVAELERMGALSRDDVVAVANRYFGDDFVAVRQVNGQHEVPPVEKPVIDPIEIDSSRQSSFAANVLAMAYDPIEPVFVEQGRDYRILDLADGMQLYYAPNPLNDLFSFSINVDAGSEEIGKLSLAAALMDVAGSASLSNEELQKAWYRMGSEFGFQVAENASSFNLSGLDAQFEDSLALMLELVREPVSDADTLEQLKGIILKARADQKLSPPAIARALYLYNRYGEESPMLEALGSAEIIEAGLDELLALPADLLGFEQTIFYTGSLPLEEVAGILRRHLDMAGELRPPPEYRFRQAREIEQTELYVVDQQTAQAQVRIEFADGVFDEGDSVPASLYTTYFGASMSSVVFQELREARGLAYSAAARYAQGRRAGDENLMLGAIGTQTDKTAEALAAFIDLIDNMPVSAERFDEAVNASVNRYRTSKLSFREVLGAVRGWERLGLEGDPRLRRYAELRQADIDDLLQFQRGRVGGRPKLISILGDLSVIDIAELESFGAVRQVQVDDLFVD